MAWPETWKYVPDRPDSTRMTTNVRMLGASDAPMVKQRRTMMQRLYEIRLPSNCLTLSTVLHSLCAWVCRTHYPYRPPDERREPHGQQDAGVGDVDVDGRGAQVCRYLAGGREERSAAETRSQSDPAGHKDDQALAP